MPDFAEDYLSTGSASVALHSGSRVGESTEIDGAEEGKMAGSQDSFVEKAQEIILLVNRKKDRGE